MLRVLGAAKRCCDGVTRRDFMRIGGLGLAGLSLADLLRLQAACGAATHGPQFGKAKAVILLHLYGSPSQLEWADMKPDAPVEVRGELGGIASNVPGLAVCELFPHMARVMDRTAVIRSMTHPYPIHGVAYAWTGNPAIDVAMELRPRDPRHWPFFGSVVQYVDEQCRPELRRSPVPQNVALPFRFSSRREGEVPRAGPYAAFLGPQYDPIWTDYRGTPTKGLRKTLQDKEFTGNDPFIGTSPDTYFTLPGASELLPGLTLDRLDKRRSLLEQLNGLRRDLDRLAAAGRLDRYQEQALALLGSEKLAAALDIRRESPAVQELYGESLFGKACLAARRLVEAGSRVVTVFWDEYGLAGSGWDTHWNHYPRMRIELAPGFDRAWYGLITDLDQRGLLDEVLVVCGSEHGRTPYLNKAQGGGRDHWSRVYTTLVAGAGVKRGFVLGASDRLGAEVADRPVSPKDLLATMYHLLGIDPHMTIPDAQGRALPLVEGELVHELLA
ncbi:MAG: hypothetical protein KatS3mg110_0393 [Pirellulaceae bacterium]|nr:MAG: hypothetical protein KatS3mg110_0393 [Pirellulaceae bacterium]